MPTISSATTIPDDEMRLVKLKNRKPKTLLEEADPELEEEEEEEEETEAIIQ